MTRPTGVKRVAEPAQAAPRETDGRRETRAPREPDGAQGAEESRRAVKERLAAARQNGTAPEYKAPAHPAVRAAAMLAALAGTVAFSVVLARLTLEPSPASVALTYSNVHPGQSIRAYLDHGTAREAARQVGGNLLLGVPFGVLLPVLVPQARGLARVAVCTTVVMVLVELVQGALVTGRAFDIDDVILNTSGALLGYLFLGRRLGRAVHPRRYHWWHRFTRRTPAG
ncbi:VanZ family protein [Streptomyces sp. NPDC002044]|uniref:VanZ family protein n=1 Tax=Streptomyces sp. NPDC002044 TaxID=3154662 RepID=UPI00331D2AC4